MARHFFSFWMVQWLAGPAAQAIGPVRTKSLIVAHSIPSAPSLFRELVGAHTPASKGPDIMIHQMMERLRNHPLDVDFSIRHRILQGKDYHHGSCLQVKEISEALGYSDIYFFSRQFKQATGMSPLEYRKSGKVLPRSGTAQR